MKRKLKILGSVVSVVFAISAVGVPSASAQNLFHSSQAPTTFNGSQSTTHVFTTTSGTVFCKVAVFTGSMSSFTSNTVTLTPKYEQCTAFGFFPVAIDTNGCGYLFNASGTTNIECPGGKSIEITAPGCTISIGAQHINSGMSYTTIGAPPKRHITAHANISGITYTECGGALQHSGTFKGSTTVTGTSGDIWYGT